MSCLLLWCCPKVPSVRRTCEGYTLEGLQYVHDLLIVAGESGTNIHPSKGVVGVWE